MTYKEKTHGEETDGERINGKEIYEKEIYGEDIKCAIQISVAPPTQGTWRSDDYVSAFRLVDAWLFLNWVGGAVYVHIGWSTQTCATTLVITFPTSTSHSRVPLSRRSPNIS